MALRIQRRSMGMPRWYVFALIGLAVVALVSGWYMFRWYAHGEEMPVSLPMFSETGPSIEKSSITPELLQQHQVDPQHPRYLSIPSLGLSESRIFAANATEEGVLADPSNLNDVSWFKESSLPGERGVLVMGGYGATSPHKGVFANIHRLGKGDIVQIENGAGERFRYEVRENDKVHVRDIGEQGLKVMMESAEGGREALNIIASDGVWVPRLGQYDHKVMLRAVLVE